MSVLRTKLSRPEGPKAGQKGHQQEVSIYFQNRRAELPSCIYFDRKLIIFLLFLAVLYIFDNSKLWCLQNDFFGCASEVRVCKHFGNHSGCIYMLCLCALLPYASSHFLLAWPDSHNGHKNISYPCDMSSCVCQEKRCQCLQIHIAHTDI